MSDTDPAPADLDPGNADPEAWTEDLTADELADVLAVVDDPDPLVTAGLAGTLYDPEFAGPGDLGDLDQEGATDGGN